jgi:predicted transcriptional regulator
MEQTTQTKTIDWPWIVEFFTKRGRPLTREEIKKLQDEDKRIKEEENELKKQNEEAEKRRMARILEELEKDGQDDDYERQ